MLPAVQMSPNFFSDIQMLFNRCDLMGVGSNLQKSSGHGVLIGELLSLLQCLTLFLTIRVLNALEGSFNKQPKPFIEFWTSAF